MIYLRSTLLIYLILLSFDKSSAQVKSKKTSFAYKKNVHEWLKDNKVPAMGIGIIENGVIKHVRVFGNLEGAKKTPENTLFNIASVTKPVATILTLKLVASGQWDLDEPLSNYWIDPDLASDTLLKTLTTRHILIHQSGFPNWRWNLPGQKLAFEFSPGTHYQYSGEGFDYLRRAIESKFHKPFALLLDSLIFQPLKMKDTGYWSASLDTTRFAAWHNREGERYSNPINTSVSAADDLITTVKDMCKFMIYVMNGAELPSNLYQDMVRPQSKVTNTHSYGLGWGVIENLFTGEYALEHAGADMGVRTRVIILPKSKRGLVVFTNGDNGVRVYAKTIEQTFDVGKQIVTSLR